MVGRRGRGRKPREPDEEILDEIANSLLDQTDPDPTNAQAIRCYEKAGFHAVSNIVTPDGPALLMVIDRHADEEPKRAD